MDTQSGGAGDVGSIFATISLDTNNAETKADSFGGSMTRAAKAAEKLDAATKAAAAATAAQAASAEAASSAFAGYASQTTDSVQAAKALAQAQKDSQAAASAAFASYGGLGEAHVRVTAAANIGAAATAKAAGSTRNLGYAGLTAGRALQDFTQGGLGGILNNIEGLTMGLGGGAGLAGLLTAVGVAAFVAKPFLEKMFSSKDIDPFKTQMETIKDRIDELNKKEVKIGVDRLELDRLEKQYARIKKAQDDFDAATGRKSRVERQSETAVKEAIDEAGAGDVRDKLKNSIGKRLLANESDKFKQWEAAEAEAERALKDAETRGVEGFGGDAVAWAAAMARFSEQAETLRQLIRSRLVEIVGHGGEADQAVGYLIGEAEAGKVGEHQEELATALDQSGQGVLASQVRGMSPKDFREQEASKESVATIEKRREDRKKASKGIEADFKDAEDEWFDMKKEDQRGDYADAAYDFAAAKKGNSKQTAADKEVERAAERNKLRGMNAAQKRAYQIQKDRAIIDGRAGPEGGGPAMPDAPATGVGDVGMTARQAEEMLTYLKQISGNTDDMGDGAAFG